MTSESQVLVVVPDNEGNFRLSCQRKTLVASHRNEVVAVFNHEGQTINVVDLDEVTDFIVREFWVHREVPSIDGV